MLVLPLLTGLALAGAAPLAGQPFPGFGGLEVRAGALSPENAKLGFGATAKLDLGYLGSPVLRTFLGATYWAADAERADATGSFSSLGGQLGLRFDLLPTARLAPYLYAAAVGQNVSASLDNAALEETLSGFNVGGALGGGLTYALDEGQRTRATLDVRQVFVNNFNHWGAELGIRLVPRGRDAYQPVARYRDPFYRTEAERARAEAERARAERERLEAERLRTEQERERERLAEQERLARMTEEERLRAEREAEAARRQAAAEAEARAAAEAEAERARREAERARAEAAAAEQRAAEAEARLYQSLLDLDRLIANITEIRETERGLVIVLGQGLFAVGQHTLSPRAHDEVRRIAAVLLQYPQYRISVEGHTDSTGSLAVNQRLSEQRAASVRAALVAEGVDPGRIDTVGHGPALPIADNATAQGRAQNRRVEIVLLGARRPGAM